MTAPNTWPILRHRDGRPPVVSSGWGSKRGAGTANEHMHVGADVMYKRAHEVSDAQAKAEHGSPKFELAAGTPIVAAGAGKVIYVGKTKRGIGVIIDHGAPWKTFYQHLDTSAVKKGDQVAAGEVIGTAGHGEGSIRHLHFELWYNGRPVDACTGEGQCLHGTMGKWQILSQPTVGGRASVAPPTAFNVRRAGAAIASAGVLAAFTIAIGIGIRRRRSGLDSRGA